ncbi:hypothetical protein SELMODRAFT_446038 [Selaginella moellendorffii]|uniref:Calponin-homology (CH) domain-containing protein n=1 Tax=Selaginella moellendorffii TaxID=88036 RepID=D8SN73_SELML|nr:hypothetical protein SELMODRAFT_446038 [Selaginella moellendorffii]
MAAFGGVVVSYPLLESQFTLNELRSLKSEIYLEMQRAASKSNEPSVPVPEKIKYHIDSHSEEKNSSRNDLFDAVQDGILICKLINVPSMRGLSSRFVLSISVLSDSIPFWRQDESGTRARGDGKRYRDLQDPYDRTKAVLAQGWRRKSSTNNSLTYAELIQDHEQDSRDERVFRVWINSLGTTSMELQDENAVSAARKLGCSVFLLWDEMVMILVATVMLWNLAEKARKASNTAAVHNGSSYSHRDA